MKLAAFLKKSKLTQKEFGRQLDVSQGMVAFWLSGKRPTIERAIQIEQMTQGAVSLEDLRSDVDWRYLRGRRGDRRVATQRILRKKPTTETNQPDARHSVSVKDSATRK